jgi:hypothetical protein
MNISKGHLPNSCAPDSWAGFFMLMAFPFLANRPFIPPLNLNGLRCFCKPEICVRPLGRSFHRRHTSGNIKSIGAASGERGGLRLCWPTGANRMGWPECIGRAGSAVTGSQDEDEVAMLLVSAKIGPFKSIEKPEEVKIEDDVTVLVGMNGSGKTVLEALAKSDDIFDLAKFDYVEDYPRKNLRTYESRHLTNPDTATVLTYELTDSKAAAINQTLRTQLPKNFRFLVNHDYQNRRTISLAVDNKSVIAELTKGATSTNFPDAITNASSITEIPKTVEGLSLTDADKQYLASINQRIDEILEAKRKPPGKDRYSSRSERSAAV